MAFPTDVDATWVNPLAVALNGGELRRADAAMFAGAGSAALGVRGGIVRHSDTSLAVTVDGSDVVTVQPGPVVIPGNAVAGTGCYRSALPAVITGALGARHASFSRIDLIVFRQLDTDVVGTHGAYTARVDVVPGTASSTPAAPALPSMAVELGRITLPPTGGGAATVDSSFRTYASAIGGRLAVPTEARLPVSAVKYEQAVALDTGIGYDFDGTSWVKQGTWIAYTPVWGATGTAPALGNGSISGKYRRVGNTIDLQFTLTLGSSSTPGTGVWTVTLPPFAAAGGQEVGSMRIFDDSASNNQSGTCYVEPSDLTVVRLLHSTGSITPTAPWTWANHDSVQGGGRYEAAA